MSTEAKPKLTVRETAKLLMDEGVHIAQCFEPGQSKFRPDPSIVFLGDEEEGHRAIQILWQKHGIRISILRREWRNADPDGIGGYYDQVVWIIVLPLRLIRSAVPNVEAVVASGEYAEHS